MTTANKKGRQRGICLP